jgi:TatD DNase family protein
MLIDSHCHLDRIDLAPFDNDFDRMMDNAREEGVEHVLCVSIDLESYPAMVDLVGHREEVSVSVGVHPNDHDRHEPTVEELVELAADPRNVAIGETGLDYFRSEGDLSWQQERFRRHIRAAKQCRKPLIIHTRAAKADTLKILEEEGADQVGGVLHCFTEDWEMAEKGLEMGFYISFSGIVTFNSAKALREVAAKVPEDRFLIETDAPYLAPVPHRGKPNIPHWVRHVADCLGEVRGTSSRHIAEVSGENYRRLFGR